MRSGSDVRSLGCDVIVSIDNTVQRGILRSIYSSVYTSGRQPRELTARVGVSSAGCRRHHTFVVSVFFSGMVRSAAYIGYKDNIAAIISFVKSSSDLDNG